MALGSNSFNSVAGRLPGAQMPTQSVGQFQNQQLGRLMTNTGPTPSQPITSVPRTMSGQPLRQSQVSMSVNRTTDAVRASSVNAMGSAQMAGARRKREQAARVEQAAQAAASMRAAQAQQRPMAAMGRPQNNGSGYQPNPRGGQTVTRVQGMLKGYPGLRITEIGGNRESDQRRGVKRWSGSLHYDSKNPAVDIGGSTKQLDALYQQMRAEGGFRQILWRVPNHYDHIHVG
jgi:hypothetical protein